MEATVTSTRPDRTAQALRAWSRLGLLSVNIVFWVLFAVFAPGFLSDYNLFTLLRFASIQIVVGLAQMVMFSAGEMNLAVGAIGAVAAIFSGGLMQALGV